MYVHMYIYEDLNLVLSIGLVDRDSESGAEILPEDFACNLPWQSDSGNA